MAQKKIHGILPLSAHISAIMDGEENSVENIYLQDWWKKPEALSIWESYHLIQSVLKQELPVIVEMDFYKRVHAQLPNNPHPGFFDIKDLSNTAFREKYLVFKTLIAVCSVILL